MSTQYIFFFEIAIFFLFTFCPIQSDDQLAQYNLGDGLTVDVAQIGKRITFIGCQAINDDDNDVKLAYIKCTGEDPKLREVFQECAKANDNEMANEKDILKIKKYLCDNLNNKDVDKIHVCITNKIAKTNKDAARATDYLLTKSIVCFFNVTGGKSPNIFPKDESI